MSVITQRTDGFLDPSIKVCTKCLGLEVGDAWKGNILHLLRVTNSVREEITFELRLGGAEDIGKKQTREHKQPIRHFSLEALTGSENVESYSRDRHITVRP